MLWWRVLSSKVSQCAYFVMSTYKMLNLLKQGWFRSAYTYCTRVIGSPSMSRIKICSSMVIVLNLIICQKHFVSVLFIKNIGGSDWSIYVSMLTYTIHTWNGRQCFMQCRKHSTRTTDVQSTLSFQIAIPLPIHVSVKNRTKVGNHARLSFKCLS